MITLRNANDLVNVINILNSIDEVPGMPVTELEALIGETRQAEFRVDPIRFFRRADDATRDCIWAEVMRRVQPAALLAAAE